MNEKYTKAFKEIHVILKKSSKEELNKIPKSFIQFIEKNMDVNYTPKIEFNENFEKSVLEETLLILALIYRDYLISDEERKKLIESEQKQLEILREKYNPDNLFKNNKKEFNVSSVSMEQQLIEIKQEKWYKSFLKKILDLFRH